MRVASTLLMLAMLNGCGDPRPSPDQEGDFTISRWTLPLTGGSLAARQARVAAERFCGPGKPILIERASLDYLLAHVTITFRCGR